MYRAKSKSFVACAAMLCTIAAVAMAVMVVVAVPITTSDAAVEPLTAAVLLENDAQSGGGGGGATKCPPKPSNEQACAVCADVKKKNQCIERARVAACRAITGAKATKDACKNACKTPKLIRACEARGNAQTRADNCPKQPNTEAECSKCGGSNKKKCLQEARKKTGKCLTKAQGPKTVTDCYACPDKSKAKTECVAALKAGDDCPKVTARPQCATACKRPNKIKACEDRFDGANCATAKKKGDCAKCTDKRARENCEHRFFCPPNPKTKTDCNPCTPAAKTKCLDALKVKCPKTTAKLLSECTDKACPKPADKKACEDFVKLSDGAGSDKRQKCIAAITGSTVSDVMKQVVKARTKCCPKAAGAEQVKMCDREAKNKLIAVVNDCVKKAKQTSSSTDACCGSLKAQAGATGVDVGSTACKGQASGGGVTPTAAAAADTIIAQCVQTMAKKTCCNQIKQNDAKKTECLNKLKAEHVKKNAAPPGQDAKGVDKCAAEKSKPAPAYKECCKRLPRVDRGPCNAALASESSATQLQQQKEKCAKQTKNPQALKACCDKLPAADRDPCMKAGAGTPDTAAACAQKFPGKTLDVLNQYVKCCNKLGGKERSTCQTAANAARNAEVDDCFASAGENADAKKKCCTASGNKIKHRLCTNSKELTKRCLALKPVAAFSKDLPGVVTGDDRKGVFGDRTESPEKAALLKKCKAQESFICPMCHRKTASDAIAVDHMNENHAQSTASNLRCLCSDCNKKKTSRTMDLYRAKGGVPMTDIAALTAEEKQKIEGQVASAAGIASNFGDRTVEISKADDPEALYMLAKQCCTAGEDDKERNECRDAVTAKRQILIDRQTTFLKKKFKV